MSRLHNSKATPANGTEHMPLNAEMTLGNYQHNPPPPAKKTLWQGIKEIYYEFCGNSSLHGVQYLGTHRPWKEIFLWLCVFVVSFYLASITIQKIYKKWDETPVIVSFSEHNTPISDIPFPAVTICPESRRMTTDGPTYAELLKLIQDGNDLPSNLTSSERDQFLTLLHTCNYDSLPPKIRRLSNTSTDYIQILEEMSLGLENQLNFCKWFGIGGSCEDLFTSTYTEDGLCFTFNGFNGTDLYRENTVQYQLMGLESYVASSERINRTLSWSLGQGYPKKIPLKAYPARVVSANTRSALNVLLRTHKQFLDYGCSGATQGFKIVVHTPDDVPLLSKQFMRVSLNKEVSITVKPVMVTTSGGIAGYPAEKRKCYLEGERQLKFFKVYSEKNCEIECLTNYTLEACKCVKYAMPRTHDMPVCGEESIDCYLRAENRMLLENFHDGVGDNDGCSCMPSCISLEYDTEISQADFDIKKLIKSFSYEYDEGVSVSSLYVYFGDNEFITAKRSELYGFSDFLAQCGGILGLFMGFSLLSLIEIVYHFSLRLWSTMTRKRDVK